MMTKKIFVACDTTSISKVKEIINKQKTQNYELVISLV